MADRPIPEEELYDLMFDPQERNNIAQDPAHAETLQELRSRLADWMTQTDDPLLYEDPAVIPLPQTVNTHDQPHPDNPSSQWEPAEWPGPVSL